MNEPFSVLMEAAEDAAMWGLLPAADVAVLKAALGNPGAIAAEDLPRLRGILERIAPAGALKIPDPPAMEHAVKRRGGIYRMSELVTAEDDLVSAPGGACKASSGGRLGGLLVKFRSPDRTRYRDFLTSETDFGPFIAGKLPLLLHHGLPDEVTGVAVDAEQGDLTVKAVSEGLEVDARLSLATAEGRDAYKAARAGRMGWSSGAVSHRVRRTKQADATHHLVRWWVIEGSLTRTPADVGAVARVPIDPAELKKLHKEWQEREDRYYALVPVADWPPHVKARKVRRLARRCELALTGLRRREREAQLAKLERLGLC